MARWTAGLLVLLAGCSTAGGEGASAITTRDSAGITIVSNDLTRLPATCAVDSTPITLIGVAEGAPEYMLYRVFGATQLSDGRIVVVNQGSNELRYYDRNGKFLMRAGHEGQGPGEFSNAFYIWPTRGDTVYVGDYDPWEFLVFGERGKYVKTVRPEPLFMNSPVVIGVLEDGRLLLAEDELPGLTGPGFMMRYITTALYSREGTATDTLDTLANGRRGILPGGRTSFRVAPWFESGAQVASGGTRIASGHGSRPELRLRDATNGLAVARIMRWTVQDQAITPEVMNAAREAEKAQFADASVEMRKRYLEPQLSAGRPVADELPAFTNVMYGRDRRLWVREYHRPGTPDVEHWIGFDSTGRYSCRFSIPASQELFEVGRDYLLTKDPDADGVERVARFRLGQPAP